MVEPQPLYDVVSKLVERCLVLLQPQVGRVFLQQSLQDAGVGCKAWMVRGDLVDHAQEAAQFGG